MHAYTYFVIRIYYTNISRDTNDTRKFYLIKVTIAFANSNDAFITVSYSFVVP